MALQTSRIHHARCTKLASVNYDFSLVKYF